MVRSSTVEDIGTNLASLLEGSHNTSTPERMRIVLGETEVGSGEPRRTLLRWLERFLPMPRGQCFMVGTHLEFDSEDAAQSTAYPIPLAVPADGSTSTRGSPALLLARRNKWKVVLRMAKKQIVKLLQTRDPMNQSLLHLACWWGARDALATLLQTFAEAAHTHRNPDHILAAVLQGGGVPPALLGAHVGTWHHHIGSSEQGAFAWAGQLVLCLTVRPSPRQATSTCSRRLTPRCTRR